MRLYKMELYKLYHRKIFVMGAVCVIGLMLLYVYADVSSERTFADGVYYTGYKAIQADRQITEAFKGVLTDEKIEQIVEKYGFPQNMKAEYGFIDANFLNQFVMDYFSDGYVRHWDNYETATEIYPIADTIFGKAREASGKELLLEYYKGWEVFMEVLSVGMMCGSILIIFSVSVVFANERQVKMLPLLFTTANGRKKDTRAKIAASFTITVLVWLVVVILNFAICGAVYGLDGGDCFAGLITGGFVGAPVNLIAESTYVMISLLLSFAGFVSLCAITICVSAHSASSFHAVVVAAVCWGSALLLRMFFEHGFMILYAAPIFLVYYDILYDVYYIWKLLVWIAAVVAVFCTVMAYREYLSIHL